MGTDCLRLLSFGRCFSSTRWSQAQTLHLLLDFREDTSQFPLQRSLILLIIFVRQFTEAILELQIAKVAVNRLLPVLEILNGRNRDRLGYIFVAYAKREIERRNGDHDGGRSYHFRLPDSASSSPSSRSICPRYRSISVSS